MNKVNFIESQKKHLKLTFNDFSYNKNRVNQDGSIRWQCERRDLKCYVTVVTEANGQVIRGLVTNHKHEAEPGKMHALKTKREILIRAIKNLDEGPSKIIAETITPDIALELPTEENLKQMIRYHRRKRRPVESRNAVELVIKGEWTETLRKSKLYYGAVDVENERALIFTTQQNLEALSV